MTYTSFINNFEHIASPKEFRKFYIQLRLGLSQSSHQLNLEPKVPGKSGVVLPSS